MTVSRAMADEEPIAVEALNLTAPSETDVALAMRALSGRDAAPNNTICGVHRQLWALTSTLPDEDREDARRLLATAYVMGKKMYYKLRDYQRMNRS